MIQSTLYIRVVPQDRDRGYMLLAGFDNRLVQSNCSQYSTLSDISRDSLNSMIEQVRQRFSASEVKDITATNIQRQLKKMFGEPL